MAALDSSSQEGKTPVGDGVNPNITNQMQEYLVDWWPGYVENITNNVVENTFTIVTTSSFPTFTVIADKEGHTYSNDFYYRIHYTPQIVNLGNILSDQIFNLKVWNSFFIQKTISSITENALDDVSLASPISIPGVFNGLQELSFPITVTTVGEAIINGSYTFTWADSSYLVQVQGTRLILWPFAPLNEFSERREWKTEILTSIDGTEERHLLRTIPRTYFNYNFKFRTPTEFSLAQILAKKYAHARLGIPSWQEWTAIENVQAGSNSISIDTTTLELFDGQNIILWKNYKDYEVKTISSFTDTSITFTLVINKSQDSCFFIPVKVGVLNAPISFQTEDNHIQTCSLSALSTEYFNTIAWVTEFFNALPVFTEETVVTGGLEDSFRREMTFIDSETGIYETYSAIEFTPQNYTLRIKVFGRIQKNRVIKLLNYFRGKYNTFYCPTFQQDLTTIYTTLPIGTSVFPIEGSGWDNSNLYPIRIMGSVNQNVNISSIQSNPDGTDTITLTAPIGATNSGIYKICKLLKVRLNTDSIEYSYSRRECLTVTIPLIEVK